MRLARSPLPYHCRPAFLLSLTCHSLQAVELDPFASLKSLSLGRRWIWRASCVGYRHAWNPGFVNLALLLFWAGQLFVSGDCLVPRKVLSCIPGLNPLGAWRTSFVLPGFHSTPNDNQESLRTLPMSPGEQNLQQLSVSALTPFSVVILNFLARELERKAASAFRNCFALFKALSLLCWTTSQQPRRQGGTDTVLSTLQPSELTQSHPPAPSQETPSRQRL